MLHVKLLIFVFVSVLVFLSARDCAGAEKNVLFILDNSSSMAGEKLGIAKNTLLQIFKHKPKNIAVAIRVFNQNAKNDEDTCHDSEIILDFDEYDIEEVKSAIRNIRYNYKTPLAETFNEVIYDFPHDKSIREIILITDGKDTCKGDPCERASYIRKHLGVQVSVVAINVEKRDQNTLICTAETTGGRFVDIADIRKIPETLYDLIELPTSPLIVILNDDTGEKIPGHIRIYDEYGDVVADSVSKVREFSPTLPIGIYTAVAEYQGEEKEIKNIRLKKGTPKKVVLVFDKE